MLQLTREQRLIKIENLTNCRDLGGYETQSGYYTKAHKYIRSSNITSLTTQGIEALLDYGVNVVVDLRSDFEVEQLPSQLKDCEEVTYYHLDLLGIPDFNVLPEDIKNYDDLGGYYRFILESSKQRIKAVFELFVKHLDDCILFNCSSGKDRTGIIAALLMDLAGCHEYDIVKDYSETAGNIEAMMPYLEELVDEEGQKYLGSHPNNMIMMLNYLNEEYGSSRGYLLSLGISEDDLETLVENFTI